MEISTRKKMVCDVCANVFLVDPNSTSDDNNVLECIQCKTRVHQLCYGVDNFTTNWLCDFCSIHGAEIEKKCELCPKPDGALKQTTSDKWVHVICALFTSQVVITDTATMSPIDLSKVSKRLYGLSCYICLKHRKKETGACVKCFVTGCKRHLHVSCGQTAGTLQEKLSHKGNLLFIVFCEDHIEREKPRISINSIETMLRDRKKVNATETAKVKNAGWITNNEHLVSTFYCFNFIILT